MALTAAIAAIDQTIGEFEAHLESLRARVRALEEAKAVVADRLSSAGEPRRGTRRAQAQDKQRTRRLSAEGREAISRAAKARWAKVRAEKARAEYEEGAYERVSEGEAASAVDERAQLLLEAERTEVKAVVAEIVEPEEAVEAPVTPETVPDRPAESAEAPPTPEAMADQPAESIEAPTAPEAVPDRPAESIEAPTAPAHPTSPPTARPRPWTARAAARMDRAPWRAPAKPWAPTARTRPQRAWARGR